MRFSFSRIEAFLNCPFKFKLNYIDGLDTLPDYDAADNPLTIGTAMHHGIEQGVSKAIREYVMSYPVLTDEIETESLKLEVLVPKVRAMINPNAIFEFRIETDNFLGFVDYIDPKSHTLLDFKYSNNEKHYLESSQVHVYRHLLEKYYGMRIDRIGYLFIPKIKDDGASAYESIQLYRDHLRQELNNVQPRIAYVTYDENKAKKTLLQIPKIEAVSTYIKSKNRLCWYCDYRRYCESNGKEDFMILPKNERRKIGTAARRKLWIYGAPFSGKTTLADKFPNVLMLNTDGNTNFVTAPVVRIADVVEVDGHITKKTLAWKVFKDTIDELAKKQNTFESIVVDLIEDVYEACRLYMYDSLGIKHESDNPYKAWDIIRTEFLSTIKRLMNLDYQNIVLISHEDSSKDITKRNGETISTVKPNIQDKVANKLAGMVDIVIRCVVEDGDYKLSFKSDETTFGGGRMKLSAKEIPNSYEELARIYDTTAIKSAPRQETPKVTEEVKKAESAAVTATPETAPEQSVVEYGIEQSEEKPSAPVEEPKTEELSAGWSGNQGLGEEEPAPRRRRRRTE